MNGIQNKIIKYFSSKYKQMTLWMGLTITRIVNQKNSKNAIIKTIMIKTHFVN